MKRRVQTLFALLCGDPPPRRETLWSRFYWRVCWPLGLRIYAAYRRCGIWRALYGWALMLGHCVRVYVGLRSRFWRWRSRRAMRRVARTIERKLTPAMTRATAALQSATVGCESLRRAVEQAQAAPE